MLPAALCLLATSVLCPPSVAGDSPQSPIRLVYSGTYRLEAHLAKPHDTLDFQTRLTLLADTDNRARLDWESWPKGHEEQRDLDTTLIAGTRVWRRTETGKPFVEARDKSAALLRARVENLIPWRTLARARSAPQRDPAQEGGALAWTDSSELGGFARRIDFDADTHRLARITRRFAHPRLGDAADEVLYRAWEERDGVLLPSSLTMRELDGGNSLRASPGSFELRLESAEAVADLTHELAPPAESISEADPGPVVPGEIEVTELEPGVLSFASKELDGRSYAVEFDDYLIAIDAPLSSALGERIVAVMRERFPKKPLRYVLFGHFHPWYTGGLRAFLAAGAKLVAPAGCAAFAEEIAKRPFTLEPDEWARVARSPEIERFSGTRAFEDAHQRLEVFDIGARSAHTDEYLVFFLPHTHTLLEDDIGWSAASDGKLSFGRRSRGLYEFLVEQKLEVRSLWQSWPVASPRPRISFAELERGVRTPR
ncbi:MAG: hypothetical protein IPJ19_05220 [Planctomycetes bacterium]|nr:hypothetical protein [Planctomycetota bacterium]